MKYYMYIIFSKSAGRFYVGSCSNLDQRLAKHNAGATPSTKPYRPWVMAYFEVFDSKTLALKRENYIKKMKSKKYIEKLIVRGSSAG